MCKKILILCLVLSLTACGTTQVAELSTIAVESKIETTTVAETTTIVETSEEIKETVETTAEETTVEETTIPDKWAGYSEEVKKAIEFVENKDVTEELKKLGVKYTTESPEWTNALDAIRDAGLYALNVGEYKHTRLEVVDKDEAYDRFYNNFNSDGSSIGNLTYFSDGSQEIWAQAATDKANAVAKEASSKYSKRN